MGILTSCLHHTSNSAYDDPGSILTGPSVGNGSVLDAPNHTQLSQSSIHSMLPVDGATGDLHPLPRYAARNATYLAAMKIQAMVRGTQAREHVSVRTVADGVIHTRLRGESATFARLGIESLNTDNGPKMLDVLALRSDKFQGHVVGGDRLYVNAMIDKDKRQHSFGSVLGRKLPKQLLHVYINGGYFNVQRWADKHKSPHVPIGETVSIGGKTMDSIPVPQHYRNRYTSISFEDKSMVTCGPVLSEKGLTTFHDKDLLNPDYQFQDKIIKPGELNHAQHPNPRSAMSIPDAVSPQDSYRLAVATTPDKKRGSEGTGFTMPEWSRVAARFDRMNQSAGLSINLDGGASSTMGMIGPNSETLMEVKAGELPVVSTLVTFTPRNAAASKTK